MIHLLLVKRQLLMLSSDCCDSSSVTLGLIFMSAFVNVSERSQISIMVSITSAVNILKRTLLAGTTYKSISFWLFLQRVWYIAYRTVVITSAVPTATQVFTTRRYASAVYAVVYPSVRLSHAGIVSKFKMAKCSITQTTSHDITKTLGCRPGSL